VTTFGLEFAGNWVQYWASDMAYAADTFFYTDETRSKMNREKKMTDIWKYWTRFPVNDISSNVRNPAAGWTGSMFQSDRVAMVQLGYWFGAQLQENEGYQEKYGWAPTPILEPGADVYTNTLGATGVVIYAKSKYPDRAFRVFEWYMAGEYGIHRAKTGWGIPPLLSLREYLPRDNEYNRSRTEIAFEDAKYFVPWMASSLIRNAPVFGAAWNNNIDALVTGEINADTFVNRYLDDIDEELQVGKEELGL
jgi:maltose-binding protein MalE